MTHQSKSSSFLPHEPKKLSGSTLSKKQAALVKKQEAAKNGGLIRVSFTFNGKEHIQTHRLTQEEMTEQMKLLKDNGVHAFESVSVRIAVWGAARLGEHAVTEAFTEYARQHYVEPENPVTAEEVMEELAKVRGVKLLTHEQESAVDETAGLNVEGKQE